MNNIKNRPIDLNGFRHTTKQTYPNLESCVLEYVGNIFEANDDIAEIDVNDHFMRILGGKTILSKELLATLHLSNKRGHGLVGQMGTARWALISNGISEVVYEQNTKKFILTSDFDVKEKYTMWSYSRVLVSFKLNEKVDIEKLVKEIQERFSLGIFLKRKTVILNKEKIRPFLPIGDPIKFEIKYKNYPLDCYAWIDPNKDVENWNKKGIYTSSLGFRASLNGETIHINPIGTTDRRKVFGFVDDKDGKLFASYCEPTKRHLNNKVVIMVLSSKLYKVIEKWFKVPIDQTKLDEDWLNELKRYFEYERNNPPKYKWEVKDSKSTIIIGGQIPHIKHVHETDEPFIYPFSFDRKVIAVNDLVGSKPVYPALKKVWEDKNYEALQPLLIRAAFIMKNRLIFENEYDNLAKQHKEEDRMLDELYWRRKIKNRKAR